MGHFPPKITTKRHTQTAQDRHQPQADPNLTGHSPITLYTSSQHEHMIGVGMSWNERCALRQHQSHRALFADTTPPLALSVAMVDSLCPQGRLSSKGAIAVSSAGARPRVRSSASLA